MKLRKVNLEDWQTLLNWRNDPVTREYSLSNQVVEESSHIKWLTDSLANKDRELLIFESNKVAMGTIRSDRVAENKFELSWTIAPSHRGKGLGSIMLQSFLEGRKSEFIARIFEDNIGSIRMVEKNGFRLIPTDLNDLPLLFYKNQKNRTDLEIIDEIQSIRSKNNVNWMDILRLAFKHAPEESRALMLRVNEQDGKISDLLKELANNA